MTARTQSPLFNARLLKKRLETHPFPHDLAAKHEIVRRWVESLRNGSLQGMHETSLHGNFLGDIFGRVLGYAFFADTGGKQWELFAEKTTSTGGGQADAALGFFTPDRSVIHAPIELKGAVTDLDREMSRGYTPVQQGWRYANETPDCHWVIVSNYRETRLYHTNRTPHEYESFLLAELDDPDAFKRFHYLLSRAHFLPDAPGLPSVVGELLRESEQAQKEVTNRLYAEYKRLRSHLFQHLSADNEGLDPLLILEKTQKILDRVLFIAFAEDRGLLPSRTIQNAFDHVDPYSPRPRWDNFKSVFRWIDRGNAAMAVPAYNGGLFREDPVLESLSVSDELTHAFRVLSEYDFADDVSVLVLGHIFEQSVSDLEDMRAQVVKAPESATKTVSKRKREGVFYTPAFVTRYIVEKALGRTLAEKKAAAFALHEPDEQRGDARRKSAEIAAWETYRDALIRTRVLDPACGSGAFLLAAFDFLLREYEQVNAELAALRGGQESIFDLNKTILNQNLYGVDLNHESVEITRLSLWLRTAESGKTLAELDHNIRCGNSVVADRGIDARAFDWESAFPEVRADGGFDVVVGNPPYVRQELLSPFKAHLETSYASYHGMADLYVYFYELGLRLLKPGGRLSYIVTNKWMRSGYGEALRTHFSRAGVFEQILDFGHAPVFEDADVFPCIVVIRKSEPTPDEEVTVCPVPREALPDVNLTGYVGREGYPVPWRRFGKASWSLEPPAVDALMEKIRRAGVPLKEYLGSSPYYGIKTGLNEAFLIDTPTRDRLVGEDPNCAEIIKPYLRGQDIKRWSPEWAGLWMIFAHKDFDVERYQAIMHWLNGFREALENRAGSQEWWQLQSSPSFWKLFLGPKFIYQEIQFHSAFAYDDSGFFLNNKGFFLSSEDLYLLSVLNSPLIWWFNWRYLPHMKDEALNPMGELMEDFPVKVPTDDARKLAYQMVVSLSSLHRENSKYNSEFISWLRVEFDVDKPGQKLEDFASLTADEFVAEVKKRMPKSRKLTPASLARLKEEYANYAPPMQSRRAESLVLERRLSDLVNEAYGLTPEDVALLWKTAPPRTPLKGDDHGDA